MSNFKKMNVWRNKKKANKKSKYIRLKNFILILDKHKES